MGALDMGLTEDELPEIVERWRNANSNIRSLWWEMDNAATQVITQGGAVRVRYVTLAREFDYAHNVNVMTITLPSGRKLYYVNPRVGTNRFGGSSIVYEGIDSRKKWGDVETYGGKLTENCVQAIARDCLAEAIEHLEAAGFPIVFHVHDEVVIDMKPFAEDKAMLKAVTDIMTQPIPWAQDLPLGADGWVGDFFTKD